MLSIVIIHSTYINESCTRGMIKGRAGACHRRVLSRSRTGGDGCENKAAA